jgi:hypothetical protein
MSVANEDTKAATKSQFVSRGELASSQFNSHQADHSTRSRFLQISALVVGAAVAGALGLVLLVLQKKYKRVYESRMMLATDGSVNFAYEIGVESRDRKLILVILC